MTRPLLHSGFCLLLLATTTAAAADDKPPAAKDPPADKLIPVGSVLGVLQNAPNTDGLLTVRVTLRSVEPNVQAQANLLRDEQQVLNRIQSASQIRNPLQRQQEFGNILRDAQGLSGRQKDLFTVKETQTNVEVLLTDDTKIRTPGPPVAFDDKGNPKKYTLAELKELKGDDNLPGFPADKDALRQGRTVLVAAAVSRDAAAAAGKGKDAPDVKPVATIILVVAEKD
jgi:hypothetical protein